MKGVSTPLRSARWLLPLGLGALWLAGVLVAGGLELFQEKWFIMPTMLVGSLIAGATAEGGGAVAFPVLTLGLGVAPHVARDFTLMI
ncbi:MAG: sulfite exporter TauE/SafE family protein, partial [Pseudomonadota bacterium]